VKEREGKAVTSDDAFVMIAEFESDARAIIHMSAVAGVEESQIGIYGSDGQLVLPGYRCDEISGGKRSDRKVRSLEIPARYRLPRERGHFLRSPFRVLTNSLVNAIDRNLPSPSPKRVNMMLGGSHDIEASQEMSVLPGAVQSRSSSGRPAKGLQHTRLSKNAKAPELQGLEGPGSTGHQKGAFGPSTGTPKRDP